MTMKRTKFNIRTIAVTGMLGALATVLMFLEFPIPMLIPPFIKFDFSELPALLAAYAMGLSHYLRSEERRVGKECRL